MNAPSYAPSTAPAGTAPRYPTTLIDMATVRGGQRLTLRPILPQDDAALAELINRSSAGVRRHRFPSAVESVSAEQLHRLTCVDHERHLALVVTAPERGGERLVAEARYVVAGGSDSAEFVLMVDEHWQRRGIATWLLHALGRAAAAAGVDWLRGEVLHGNRPMLALMTRCHFGCLPDRLDARIVQVETRVRTLNAGRPAPTRWRWPRPGTWIAPAPEAAPATRF